MSFSKYKHFLTGSKRVAMFTPINNAAYNQSWTVLDGVGGLLRIGIISVRPSSVQAFPPHSDIGFARVAQSTSAQH